MISTVTVEFWLCFRREKSKIVHIVEASMAEVTRDDASQRQRRRKKRMSRELDDHTNESLESPSSVPERVPLQEVVDGEKGGIPLSASNNSGDQEGSSGIHQSTAERRNRTRRPKRRSRLENGKKF